MKLRTDDDIYRARLVFLGPPGYTLPIQLPYAEWLLFGLLLAAFVAVGVLVTGTWLISGVALTAAMVLTSYIWKHVDVDTPARKVIEVALTDWKSITPASERLPRMSASHIRFSELTPGSPE